MIYMAQFLKITLSGYDNIQISNTFVSAMIALEDFKLPKTICSQDQGSAGWDEIWDGDEDVKFKKLLGRPAEAWSGSQN